MVDMQAREAREALIAILSTAASMGVDIDQLCHLSAAQLDSDHIPKSQRPFVAGAIYQIGICMNFVIDAPYSVTNHTSASRASNEVNASLDPFYPKGGTQRVEGTR